MKQALQLRVTQNLAMRPQLLQSLRLLHLSALEFEQEIVRALSENAFLERDEQTDNVDEAAEEGVAPAAGDSGEACSAPAGGVDANMYSAGSAETAHDRLPQEPFLGDRWTGRAGAGAGADDAIDAGVYTAAPVSLHDHLIDQVRGSGLSERDKLLTGVVVEGLDDDGYLRQSIDDLRSVLPAEIAAEPDELAVALRFVHSLDPPGVGARSPAECLELQLARYSVDHPGRELALTIVRDHLDALAAHDTPRLLRELKCDESDMRRANDLIMRLDPHPGSRFGALDTRFVVADVVVRKAAGRWSVSVNPQVLPRIRVNELYANIYRASREGSPGLSQQLQEARWLVRNAKQRFDTILRVAQAIIDRQSKFFDYGDVGMKPLLQRDIAQEVGVHESTVSRVANAKYMATPRGLIEFKHFFGTHVVAEDGHASSSTAIRALIRYIIANERAGQPLSDIKVTRKLREYGVRVARRTVTKYRDAMRIPPVETRRFSQPFLRRSADVIPPS